MDGKLFEKIVLKALNANGLFAVRIPDAYTHKAGMDFGHKTACDFFAVRKKRSGVTPMLIEAKAIGGKSIPFNRLEDHQLESLYSFEKFSGRCRAYIFVGFYDIYNDRDRSIFAVPASVWLEYSKGDRKSLSINSCWEDDRIIHCPQVKGLVLDLTNL